MDEGYILLYRKMLNWEWMSDANTLAVFIYCLLRANWKDGKFQGTEVHRGELVTSIASLAAELGLSAQNIRTALRHLESTGEITSKSHAKYRIIAISNYDEYQCPNNVANKQLTSFQQATNKQLTTIEESNKEIREEGNNIPPLYPPKGTRTTKKMKGENNVNLMDGIIGVYGFSESVEQKLRDWMRYKGEERGDEYKETGMRALLTQTGKQITANGESAVINCIDNSMANGWKGIVWDRIEQKHSGGIDWSKV